MRDEWTSEHDDELDRILGQTTGLLAQRGDEQAVALLVDVQYMTLAATDEVVGTERVWEDPWSTGDNGPATRTIYRREALLDVDDHLIPRFTDDVCKRIAETLGYVAERNGQENVAYVRPRPALPEDDTIAIAPLPGVRLRSGNTWSPDVLVIGRGRALVIETDGPHHRSPRRYVDDRNRDLQWQRCGIPVVRLAVEDLGDDTVLTARLREEIQRHLSRA